MLVSNIMTAKQKPSSYRTQRGSHSSHKMCTLLNCVTDSLKTFLTLWKGRGAKSRQSLLRIVTTASFKIILGCFCWGQAIQKSMQQSLKGAILYNVPFIFDNSTTLHKHGIPEGPHRPPTLDRYVFTAFCQHFLKTLFGQDIWKFIEENTTWYLFDLKWMWKNI